MSNDYKEFWVYGFRAALEAWIEAKKIDTADGERVLPHEILVKGPTYPQEQTGVTDDGFPIYARKTGATKCLWLFAIAGSASDLLDEIKVLNGPYTIIEDTSIDELKQLYPAHCLGQGIPHIARIKTT